MPDRSRTATTTGVSLETQSRPLALSPSRPLDLSPSRRKTRLSALLVFAAAGLTSSSLGQIVYRVDGGFTGSTQNGLDWITPIANLNVALALAEGDANGGATVQIWVKATTLPYTPDRWMTNTGGSAAPTPRDYTFNLVPGVELYGGFAGSESSLDQRNFALFRSTVLSGDFQGTPINRTDDCFTVVYVSERTPTSSAPPNAEAIIDGFTITSGNASSFGSIAPSNETERENGGGIYGCGSPLKVRNVTFLGDLARDAGGGMYFGGAIDLTGGTNGFQLVNCHFYRNGARRGGGFAGVQVGDFQSTSITQNSYIYCSTFSGNEATTSSGIGGRGGAIFIGSRDAPIDICNCIMDSNRSEGAGSAAFIGGNPVVAGVRIGSCTITRNVVIDVPNVLPRGACVYYQTTGQGEQLRNSIVWNNADPVSPTNLQVGPVAMLASVSIDHCCIEQGIAGQGNKNQDPLFMGPTNYELATGSPCIDAGSDEILLKDLPDFNGDGDMDEKVPVDYRRFLQFVRSIDLVPGNTTSPTTFAPGNTDMGALEKQ